MFSAIIATLICLAITPPAHANDCTSFSSQINAAYRNGDAASASAAFRQAEASHQCSGTRLAMLGRFAALTQLKADSTNAARLQQSLKMGRPWQVLATLGDLAKAQKQYGAAVSFYQQALDDITDKTFNPRAPDNKTIAAIYQKAVIARSLANSYIKTTSNRAGKPGGLARVRFRGFSVRKIPAPVQFVYNSTSFSEKGQRAVADMLDYLTRQGSPDIQLVGHTDKKGSNNYNLKLSRKRATAVKQYLTINKYSGVISTDGKGEAEPFRLDDPALYTQNQRDQMNRRVEIIRQ